MSSKIWVALGALSAMLSVAAGAFGAHALSDKLEPRMLEVFRTGATYQMTHSLGLIAFGLWLAHSGRTEAYPGWLMLAGIVLFSGSLYALSLSGVNALGAITPIGGLCFMAAWLSFAWLAWRG